MAVAKAFPEAENKGGRGKTSQNALEVSTELIRQSRAVLRLAPDLVDAVLAGVMTVDVAYKQASLRKSEKEKQIDRLNRLAKASPEAAH